MRYGSSGCLASDGSGVLSCSALGKGDREARCRRLCQTDAAATWRLAAAAVVSNSAAAGVSLICFERLEPSWWPCTLMLEAYRNCRPWLQEMAQVPDAATCGADNGTVLAPLFATEAWCCRQHLCYRIPFGGDRIPSLFLATGWQPQRVNVARAWCGREGPWAAVNLRHAGELVVAPAHSLRSTVA